MKSNRDKKEYWASFIQRWSGVGLALFLPFHFFVLSMILQGKDALDGFLYWTESPIVKFSEIGLVGLLSIHLIGGIRILIIEFFEWKEWQSYLISIAVSGSFAIMCLFGMRVF